MDLCPDSFGNYLFVLRADPTTLVIVLEGIPVCAANVLRDVREAVCRALEPAVLDGRLCPPASPNELQVRDEEDLSWPAELDPNRGQPLLSSATGTVDRSKASLELEARDRAWRRRWGTHENPR